MKTRTLLGLTVVTLGLLAVPANAQPDSANGSLADQLQPQSELSRELDLTDTQQAEVTRIRDWEQNEIRLVGQKRMISKAKREHLIRTTREKYANDVRKLLTNEQLAKLDARLGKAPVTQR